MNTYCRLVSMLAVALLYTSIAPYWFSIGGPITPLLWIVMLAALSVPLYFTSATWERVLLSPVLLWIVLYALSTSASFAWSPQSSGVIQELRSRLLSTFLMIVLLGIFASREGAYGARQAMVPCTLLGVAFNFYEVLHPGSFSLIPGRAAGLYLNPNISAGALLLGLVLTLGLVPNKWRALYAIAVALGVFLTLSRAGVLCLALILAYQLYKGTLRLRRIVWAGLIAVGLVGGALGLSGDGSRVLVFWRLGVASGLLDRVLNPDAALQGADQSTNVRATVARQAWLRFKEHPFLGSGVGATVDWEFRESTHNIYLRHLAEFGLLGILVFPLLLLAVSWRATGDVRDVAVGLMLVLFPIGLFSHNVLDEYGMLLPMVLVASLRPTREASAIALSTVQGEAELT